MLAFIAAGFIRSRNRLKLEMRRRALNSTSSRLSVMAKKAMRIFCGR
jgi:hypothetical protein